MIKEQALYLPSLMAGTDSLYISKLSANQKTLIITNDSVNSRRIFDEIDFFAPNLKCAIFPDYEILPYERATPQKDIIALRLKTLQQLYSGILDVLIISSTTLMSRLCPKEYLQGRQFSLKVGTAINLQHLKEQLVASDYSLTTQVFEAGEFALRGGIIDIMPMGTKQIIRIELFDNEIESLAILEPQNKTVLSKVDAFELIPTREYPTDPQSLKHFAANFGAVFNQPQHQYLLKEINHAMLPAGSEFYLPLFFEHTATIFDYLDASWHVVYQNTLADILTKSWHEINRRYEIYSHQYPCLAPAKLFISGEQILAQIKQKYKRYIIGKSNEALDKYSFAALPDISVNNKEHNPLAKLTQFYQTFNGTIILTTDSIGRTEILRQTLNNYNIKCKILNSLSDCLSISKTNKSISIVKANLYNGFIFKDQAFITEGELYKLGHDNIIKRRRNIKTQVNNDMIVRDLAELQTGDYVVHVNHGIGIYRGLISQTIADIEYDMLEIEYSGESKLFIPVYNLHLISRYSQIEDKLVEINKLGSPAWNKIKTKAQKKVDDVAAKLLEIYAKREIAQGNKFKLPEEYEAFANSFGYEATDDQQRAFNSVIEDMTSQKPMDRLICGDVGFGKTEVAMRAAFICAMNGYQVAILTPTTLLTEQHFQNFINRFSEFPIKIAEISRFKSKKEIDHTLEQTALGQIDILIGTHRLIQDDIKFKKLGLVIIDEEHRFGVKQKEVLKKMRYNTDFLTLTATPIPRTLSMAMEGLRDFSIIATPPKRRLAVNTLIVNDDSQMLREAILRELRRGGQIFFLYNDVANIETMYRRLNELMPELTIAIAHGQMNETALELTIRDFILQKYNLLLCSTIIENGIDISNANTIIIYRADKFGLAQLHQLRGRVGRSHHQAYCYLIVPENVTSDAARRLEAIGATAELGGGFNLAMHDLEIRGAGEILGDKQSGDIKHVGLSLYTDMLKRAINKLRREQKHEITTPEVECEVNLNVSTIITPDYCPDIHERLIYYKRLSKAVTIDEIDSVYQDIMDNWGLPPESTRNLIQMHYLRIKATACDIQKIDGTDSQISLVFIDKPNIEPTKIISLMQKLKTVRYDNKSKLVWSIKSDIIDDKVKNITFILDELSK
ncbi:MAG: transcription-repair coupling factor [Burkholderiales bacterium]|jgi:transcription-repair coupling factor (superfamily II helicase)|nr:transcription-repair coupling factor [Burkholderiales bacterium]